MLHRQEIKDKIIRSNVINIFFSFPGNCSNLGLSPAEQNTTLFSLNLLLLSD